MDIILIIFIILDKSLNLVEIPKSHNSSIDNEIHKGNKLVEIGSVEKLKLSYCCLCCHGKNRENLVRKELMEKAEAIIEKKSDIFELFKLIDQFKVIKKLTLNENQYFLLNDIQKRTIISDANYRKSSKEFEDLKEAKYNIKKENLRKYLKRHNETNSLTSTDKLLLKYANNKVEDIGDIKDINNKERIDNSINNQFE